MFRPWTLLLESQQSSAPERPEPLTPVERIRNLCQCQHFFQVFWLRQPCTLLRPSRHRCLPQLRSPIDRPLGQSGRHTREEVRRESTGVFGCEG